MKILKDRCFDSFEVKGSKFLCFFEPLKDGVNVRERQEQLRSEHPKCVHVVYASRVLNEFNQIVENQSDDGEPKGSSGAPALNVLRGAGVINAVCYIVRYFGGTLLGVGGLVRAYSHSVNLALSKANELGLLIDFIQKQNYETLISYQELNRFLYLLDTAKISYQKDFSDKVKIKMQLSKTEFEILQPELTKLRIDLISV